MRLMGKQYLGETTTGALMDGWLNKLVIGELVKVLREDGSETRGLVLGNTITPNGVSAIWQSVSLEVHHGNS